MFTVCIGHEVYYNTLIVPYGTHIEDNRKLHFLQYIHIYAIAEQYFFWWIKFFTIWSSHF